MPLEPRPRAAQLARPSVPDVDDPPSLDQPGRVVVHKEGADYPEDAPTVAVKDLTALGIDLGDFATGRGAPVRELQRSASRLPKPNSTSLVVEKVSPSSARGDGASMTFLVLAATVPVLAAATIAALILLM